MSGNVWEWCRDRYGDISTGSEIDQTAASGSYLVFPDGNWYYDALYASVSSRAAATLTTASSALGFRVVRSAN
ncbi:MAG: SUMF1/EgtB/PvdO family nonheme iron enzyme [Spirochaetaceae bacterium]|nr:SUMF1/EgtB/PvdO family nonheme iron enzyme [Spirochaetaceae bacterium]